MTVPGLDGTLGESRPLLVRWDMNIHRTLAIVVMLAVLITAVTPARAEAIEPLTVSLIVGAAVVVLIIVGFLIVANIEGKKKFGADAGDGTLVVDRGDGTLLLVAFNRLADESP
jgi:hypothetical protein